MTLEIMNFYDIDLVELEHLLESWGEPRYRASQVWDAVYKRLIIDLEQIPNIPKPLRTKLKNTFSMENLHSEITLSSNDEQTTKTLFRLGDEKAIETVLMRYQNRRTLCISSQSGCALGCVFCATGQMGLNRNLSSGEIVEQVLVFKRSLKQNSEGLTNVVVMGMGEPFHNYVQTLAAIDRLNHPAGMNLGARRFTISTVGLIPQILRFANEKRQINLAVSLHAADDNLRSSILPINIKYPLRDLFDACQQYVDITHRRITFEWALIDGVNDSLEQANQLIGLIKGMLCHVNIIPLNPTDGYNGSATSNLQAQQFQSHLEQHGIPCTIRVRRGIDIHAGCGQLATKMA
ncbi:MAG TPA: 23S rRNA (adenine(2503)-C(2))-methyltransferase RlmN [Anaerolineales bacterium]|nr:23S rRNA (adenine(2503)-C(2))-methyltransferase RlmN [Anaerolineales bacterium]